ncbi:putative TonB-dependent receptor [hydrothermal vent metagenome]|uniref:Putative TonB-dependent receptor n=1 Tax=hydrothermal vent metagenome TaxID=652676 RepID=A0A3B0RF63_9ZZZZ
MRFFLGLPLAGIITIGLFLLMKLLISKELVLPEKEDAFRFSINPKVEELSIRQRDVKAERTKDVKPPPPPPQIEKQKAIRPQEGIANISGAIPDFEAPELNRGAVNFNVSDRDAQPLVRIPPMYPPRAAERGTEGSCQAFFDVSPLGKPYNVRAECSSSVFSRSAIRSVEKWKYNPKIVDGTAVARSGVVTTITYRLAD